VNGKPFENILFVQIAGEVPCSLLPFCFKQHSHHLTPVFPRSYASRIAMVVLAAFCYEMKSCEPIYRFGIDCHSGMRQKKLQNLRASEPCRCMELSETKFGVSIHEYIRSLKQQPDAFEPLVLPGNGM
jgi:hypothetical protein